ncbi:hypothetical protein JXR93_02485 [bacterium]|nr:hypothetical protein [bacterium]
MLRVTIFLMISFFIFSCSEKKETVESICSPEDIYGICENESDMCYQGVCIPMDASCDRDNIMAPCYNESGAKDKNLVCKLIDGYYTCELQACSPKYPKGRCNIGQTCVTGVCKDLCSSEFPNGYCENSTETCLKGDCIETASQCSITLPNGLCPENMQCSAGVCEEVCSITYPNGYCVDGKTCLDGSCVNDSSLCSDVNPGGLCPNGEICRDKSCKNICSSEFPEGECVSSLQLCKLGVCEYKCSALYPDGVCLDESDRCINSNCLSPCSSETPNGYCDDGFICKDNSCQALCSTTHPEGICLTDETCFNGSCQYPCSNQHSNGFCEEQYYICDSGDCILGCSPQNTGGKCPNDDEYCHLSEGVCKKYPCSLSNLNGECADSSQRCVEGVCKSSCSIENTDGYCSPLEWTCYNGLCVDPETQDCSIDFPNGYCPEHYQCISGECIEDYCSLEYPTGRCDNGRVCALGVCVIPDICSDGRPLDGSQGACCQTDGDCNPAFSDLSSFGQGVNVCIQDHYEGFYCMEVDLATSLGGSGCNDDSQCVDQYPGYGETQDFICNRIDYSFAAEQVLPLRFCQRVFGGYCGELYRTIGRTTDAGEYCQERCHDLLCKPGLHCFNSMCTRQCDISLGVFENPNCPVINGKNIDCLSDYYEIPDTSKSYPLDICSQTCKSNNDCTVQDTECNKISLMPNRKATSVCSTKNTTGASRGEYCTDNNHEACQSGFCNGEDNKCTTLCDDDNDCGSNSFCNYFFGVTVQGETTTYLGYCRDLTAISSTTRVCNHRSDCDDPNHYCIPQINADDSVTGVCGLLGQTSFTYQPTGGFCDNSLLHCQSDICLNDECIDFCRNTSSCGTNQMCQRIQIRDGGTLQGNEIYSPAFAGGCFPFEGSMDSCSQSFNPCSNGEYCYVNAPGSANSSSLLEYLCVKPKTVGKNLFETCSTDNECKSHICHNNYCTVACSADVQCSSLEATCNEIGRAVVTSLNPANNVYGGVCER